MPFRPTSFRLLLCLFIALAAVSPPASPPAMAQEAEEGDAGGLRVPRFATTGSNEINVRTGPGSQYPIAWKYVRSGLPVEIVADFEYWRKIRDHDGTLGWVHKSLLSGRRSALVEGGIRVLRGEPSDGARPLLRLEAGVIVRIDRCRGDWCRATVEGRTGWLRRDALWGVYPDETLD